MNNSQQPGFSDLLTTVEQPRCLVQLSVSELSKAERYWLSQSQTASFPKEMKALKSSPATCLPNNSILLPFSPFLDQNNMMQDVLRIPITHMT